MNNQVAGVNGYDGPFRERANAARTIHGGSRGAALKMLSAQAPAAARAMPRGAPVRRAGDCRLDSFS